MTGILSGIERDGITERGAEADRLASTYRLASTLVRRRTDRHRCSGLACRHRNCGRDRRHRAMLLDVLGLDDATALPADYGSKLEWVSVTRADVQAMRQTM